MIRRLFSVAKQSNHRSCNQCASFQRVLEDNVVTERCTLFLHVKHVSIPLIHSAKPTKPHNMVYTVEPEFARNARNDENKCGIAGKYFWKNTHA
jgi:hypothetical protein